MIKQYWALFIQNIENLILLSDWLTYTLKESGHIRQVWEVSVYLPYLCSYTVRYFIVFKTANFGNFADPGHQTALYGSSTVTNNLPFSRWAENDP